ncbi:MAG: hypothetical protein Q8R57_05665 [Bacteroidota bacterium]|nr:hypothetical protein [Bacteroidota bacterium]
MKSAIKTFLVVVAVATTTHIAIAQTPYDDFAPSSKKKEMLKLPESVYKLRNKDTTSNIKYIVFDKENLTLSYLGKNDSTLNIFALKATEFKWWSVDPMAKKYPSSSPYNYVDGNPITRTDPNGADWFKDDNGNTQWHDNTSQGFSDKNKVSWTNIGTEMLEFSGDKLTYSWQTSDKNGKLQVNSMSFNAVAGRADNQSGTPTFNYSEDNQKKGGIGGLPSGLYYINKSELQLIADRSTYDAMKGVVGGGSWPGGENSWGRQRWWLKTDDKTTSDKLAEYNRSGFTIHGGGTWGSAGCVDLANGMTDFTREIMSRFGEKVYLKVDYTTPVLKLLSTDGNTWQTR